MEKIAELQEVHLVKRTLYGKGLSCDTDDADTIIGIMDVALNSIHNEITGNANTSTKDGAKLAASLLKAADKCCRSIFKAESKKAKKADPGKLSVSVGKAGTKFTISWYKAINKAVKKGETFNGDIFAIAVIVDDMVVDVLDGMGL